MGQIITRRKQIPITYVTNGVQQIQLNKSLVYRDLFLVLSGAPTLTSGNNSVANTAKGDEWGVVKRVRIIANSSDVLFDMTGDQLWWYNYFMFGAPPNVTPAIGDGATANPAFTSVLCIPFLDPLARKEFDEAFDSGGLTDFRVELTWGTFTDVNSAATAWTANPQIVLTSIESELGDYTPLFIPRRVTQQQIVSGASTAFRFPLDVGPTYRSVLINATTNASPAVDTAGLITNVRLVSGSNIFVDWDEATMLAAFHLEFGVRREQYATGASAGVISQVSPRVSASSNIRAWYMLNLLTRDGYLTEAINTSGLNEIYLEFATSAGCIINVISHQLLVNPAHAIAQAATAASNQAAAIAQSPIVQQAAAITASVAPVSSGSNGAISTASVGISARAAHAARRAAKIQSGRRVANA